MILTSYDTDQDLRTALPVSVQAGSVRVRARRGCPHARAAVVAEVLARHLAGTGGVGVGGVGGGEEEAAAVASRVSCCPV